LLLSSGSGVNSTASSKTRLTCKKRKGR
jgi:hypothetical protein